KILLRYKQIFGGVYMGIGSIGIPGLILILVVALLIFGPNKLHEIGKAFGETLKGFKEATNYLMSDDDDNKNIKENKNTKEDRVTTKSKLVRNFYTFKEEILTNR